MNCNRPAPREDLRQIIFLTAGSPTKVTRVYGGGVGVNTAVRKRDQESGGVADRN